MAFTSGLAYAQSDGGHAVEMVAKGKNCTADLPDLPGNDYDLHKGDLWKINLHSLSCSGSAFTGCIRKGDITSITITESSDDAWNIDSVITILKASYFNGQYWNASEVATMDMDVNRWIDADYAPEHRRFELTLLI